jgi:nicotinamide-nucleotide amidase
MAVADRELARLAARLGASLLERGLRVTTAESCTGGWVAKVLTDIAGSSEWFEAGYVTYSNRAKAEMLAVPEELLSRHGAVSRPVVTVMAEQARQLARADLAVAVSGIAGPGGGSAAKPVGTVWFAWAVAEETTSRSRHFSGDREAVRRESVAEALQGLLEVAARDG